MTKTPYMAAMLPIIAQFRQKQMLDDLKGMLRVFEALLEGTLQYLNARRDELIVRGDTRYESAYREEVEAVKKEFCEDILPSFGIHHTKDPYRVSIVRTILCIRTDNLIDIQCASELLDVTKKEWEDAIGILGEIACTQASSESAAWVLLLKNLSRDIGMARFASSKTGQTLFLKKRQFLSGKR